jgi:hypothetical protein
MATGVYRTEDGWVQVAYGRHWFEISRQRYEDQGYKPAFDLLPLEHDSEAVEVKHRRSAELDR